MDRTTRHDLKSDKFVQEVAHSVEFLESHRGQLIRYGSIVLALVVVGVGLYYFLQTRKRARFGELSSAMLVYNSAVGPDLGNRMRSFPTEEARQQAIKKSMNGFIEKYAGTEEAGIASYLLGTNAADQGDIPAARRYLAEAMKEGGKDYGSLAKFALAGIASSEGKNAEAEQLLRELVANPTVLVGKEQATIALAQAIASSKPDEARKLLEPLRTETGAASRTALTVLADLNKGK
ncbi:MAG TPA: tetratricopeptide repeat protein [Bryobacteraceae bacterium]|nr:tetratricopeptide repeat protein [Bryobacteraceae bacterium]HPT26840.1 tetratricopeptide repeat protein [Bryobacteraceae bacterium]